MSGDPAIIEAAAHLIAYSWDEATDNEREYSRETALAVLAAVTPLIEDAYARKLNAAEEIARKGNEYAKGWKLLEDDGSVTTLGETIIEAAARALQDSGDEAIRMVDAQFYAAVVVDTVTPPIRAAALEEAAKVAEEHDVDTNEAWEALDRIAAAIRALKEQP